MLTAINAKLAAQTAEGEKVKKIAPLAFKRQITEKMKLLKVDDSFLNRYLNDGFSGGEKKRMETLQLAMLNPTLAILDETDSGLDIDALRVVGRGVAAVRAERPALGVLAITHYERLLTELVPDVVHILMDGRVVASGGPELAAQIESSGYEAFR
jgi:Fe-S cluster assembly ATP-binding protein